MSEAMMGEAGEDDMGDLDAGRRTGRDDADDRQRGTGRSGHPVAGRRTTCRTSRKSRSHRALYGGSSTRWCRRRRCATPEELATAAATSSGPAAGEPPGFDRQAANRLQRRLMAQQTRSWEFNLEEGLAAGSEPSRSGRDQPASRAVLQGREGHGVPRYGGYVC